MHAQTANTDFFCGKTLLSACLAILSLYLLTNTGAGAFVSAPRDDRIWEQRRPHLGAETTASAPRFGRVWEQMRQKS